jgi:tetrachlorobenzoquinone reductase
MSETKRLNLRVIALRYEVEGVVSVELGALDNAVLPAVDAGAHIDLHLANGLTKSYSLVTPRCSPTRYVVAVLLDRASKGGSRYVHHDLRVGMELEIGGPRNHFKLDESATQSVLIAGGIGITPIFSMYARLLALGKAVTLLYCGRSRAQMALIDDINALTQSSAAKPVEWHIDTEAGGPPDLKGFLSRFDKSTDFYCCGPTPMLDGFEQICDALAYDKVHVERFAAVVPSTPAPASGAYELILKRSNKTLQIESGQNLYDVFTANKVDVEFGCKEGICGACETKVLEGVPEHRDSVLSKSERAANKTMMVCVSGCSGARLVLDL